MIPESLGSAEPGVNFTTLIHSSQFWRQGPELKNKEMSMVTILAETFVFLMCKSCNPQSSKILSRGDFLISHNVESSHDSTGKAIDSTCIGNRRSLL